MLKLKRLGVAAGLTLTLIAAGCGAEEEAPEDTEGNGDTEETPEETDTDDDDEGAGESASNYGEEIGYEITGIEPGAGVVGAAESSVEEYDSLAGWEVVTSSSGAMATALGEAINNEEPIIVTGWSPHWKFEAYDLKYLDDPDNVFGEAETIETMVREGLEEDAPNSYTVLEQFEWTEEEMNAVMLDISEGASPEDAATTFVEENQEMVDSWTEGAEGADGESLELVYVEWDTEVASTHVIAEVLTDLGADVTVTPLDNAVMWEAVASGDADGMVAAWLPGTHGDLYEQHQDNLVELGVNLEGAAIGLVVPEYMDVDSIEDLDPAE